MKVLVSGTTGLVGSALCQTLESRGHSVTKLVRKPGLGANTILWNARDTNWPSEQLADFDAVVHLAGENIAKGRWTEERKRKVRESRVDSTRLLSTAMAAAQYRPKVFLCASAIGYYGDRGDEICTERSPAGSGFLPEVCAEWEDATIPAIEAEIRVVNMRIGVVLSRAGGALHSMLPPFKLGLGGRLGSGRQFMSTIAIDDVVGAILHCLTREDLRGPVNFVNPESVTNQAFTKTLGSILHRPTVLPMPAFFLKLALGQMAEELLLSSTRVEPQKLLSTGYEYICPNVESSLRHVLQQQ